MTPVVQTVTAYRDVNGRIHESLASALLVNIERALGDGASTGASITPGIAKLIAERSDALIPLLEAWKAMPKPTLKAVA